jgi:hypothetical protein
MPILPREATQRATELSGNAWKVVTNLYDHRNILTGKCNPSHETISRESGVEICGVSTAKAELKRKGWIDTRGKRDVILLVGIEELERVREAELQKQKIRAALRFGRTKEVMQIASAIFGKSKDNDVDLGDSQRSGEDIFGKSKDNDVDLGVSPGRSLEIPKTLRNSSEIEDTAAAAAASSTSRNFDPNFWKQEAVTTPFLDELVTRGLFSEPVVREAWQELAFAVAQRGPDARATKGELMGFCRAKQRTGTLAGVSAEVVEMRRGHAAPARRPQGPQPFDCDRTCALCYGTQMETTERGARRCPNREARKRELEGGAETAARGESG